MGRFEPNNKNWIRISIKRGNIQTLPTRCSNRKLFEQSGTHIKEIYIHTHKKIINNLCTKSYLTSTLLPTPYKVPVHAFRALTAANLLAFLGLGALSNSRGLVVLSGWELALSSGLPPVASS